MIRLIVVFLTIIAFVFITSCAGDEVDPVTADMVDCTTVTPTYAGDIKEIMDGSCATSGCHNAGTQAKGIDLSTFDLVKSEGSKNRFLGSIRHESGFDQMPQGRSKLPQGTIDMIACWIQNGSPE